MLLAIQGSQDFGKPGKVRELNLMSGKTGKVRESFLVRAFFHTLVVCSPSLLVNMPNYFLGLLKTAGKDVKKLGNFLEFCLETWKGQGIF